MHCGAIEGSPYIRAFVVGHTIYDKTEPVQTIGEASASKGRVDLVTYTQLVRTAHQRLFKLRDKVQKYGSEAQNPCSSRFSPSNHSSSRVRSYSSCMRYVM
jgi:rRNA maturation protein Nop10